MRKSDFSKIFAIALMSASMLYVPKAEAMIPVIKREMPLKCHCHRADDILTVIRIAKEYDIKVTLDHVTDARCIIPQIKDGLSATVYTQITDVEDELNGLLTYDREIQKVDFDTLKKINERVKLND